MKFYADRPGRRLLQLGADLLAVAAAVLSVLLALQIHERLSRLRVPGERMIEAGVELQSGFHGAAEKASRIPLVGDGVASALSRGTAAGSKLIEAGNKQLLAVDNTAFWVALTVAVLPIVVLLVSWLPWRVRFIRNATAARRLLRSGVPCQDLLALRALTTAPLGRAGAGAGMVAAWRHGDHDAIATLAAAELDRLGLRPPRVGAAGG